MRIILSVHLINKNTKHASTPKSQGDQTLGMIGFSVDDSVQIYSKAKFGLV